MFRKDSVDVIDLTDLHKRKIIKLSHNDKKEDVRLTNDGFFDLSKKQEQISQNPPEIKKEESPSVAVSNFLSDFASIGAISQSTSTEVKENPKEDAQEVKDLKWRIENLEFKLEQLIEKVNSIKQ